jgi:hypothetical protein
VSRTAFAGANFPAEQGKKIGGAAQNIGERNEKPFRSAT